MNRGWVFTSLLLLLFLSGCLQAGDLRGPQTAETVATLPATGDRPNLVGVQELQESPELFEGQLIELSGDFYPGSAPVCDGKVYEWPGKWRLTQEELELAVAVPEDMQPAFERSDQAFTVEGYWRNWPGFAGCGRSKPQPSAWYLQVVRIVSPTTLAFEPTKMLAQFMPLSDQQSIDSGFEETAALPPDQLPLAATATPATVQPIIPTATSTELDASATTEIGSPYPGPSTMVEQSPTATVGSTPVSGTAIPSSTPTGTPISTPTPNPRFSPTPTVSGPQTITNPGLEKESLETAELGPGDTHIWPYTNDGNHTLRLQLAVEEDLAISVRVLNPDGQVRQTSANSGQGELLVLGNISLPTSGTYQIEVLSENDTAGDYAILATDETSYDFEFQGLIEIGQSGSGQFEAETDHFWHFSGTAGESVTITLEPEGDEDLFLRLFDTEGKSLVTQHNETGAGQSETMTISALPATGLYSLLVGEFDFNPASYTLELN